MAIETNSVVWAADVADHVREYGREPLPPVRGYHAARERARHANAKRWASLCWAYRVLRTADSERATSIKQWCLAVWGKAPQTKWEARVAP